MLTAFPALGSGPASELIPGKEELSTVKLCTHRGNAVTVYMSGGNPILFELEKNLYPTGMAVGWRGLLASALSAFHKTDEHKLPEPPQRSLWA